MKTIFYKHLSVNTAFTTQCKQLFTSLLNVKNLKLKLISILRAFAVNENFTTECENMKLRQ